MASEQSAASIIDGFIQALSREPRIAGQAAWLWDVPSIIICFSREWQEMLGAPEGRDVERNVADWWPDLVHEDDIVPFLEKARDIAEGSIHDYQTLFRVRNAQGEWAWMLSRGRVTETRAGVPLRVTGLITDVSCLRSDLKFQHGSISPLLVGRQSMFENSPDLIIRLDGQNLPVNFSPLISRHLPLYGTDGPQPVWAAGSQPETVTPEHLDFLQRNMAKVFKEGAPTRERLSFSTAYGHDVCGEYSFWPELDAEGKVNAVLVQFRDITEQIRNESNVRLSEMRLEALNRLNRMGDAPEEELLRFTVESLVKITGSESAFLFFPHESPLLRGRMIWSEDLYSILDPSALPDSLSNEDVLRMIDHPGYQKRDLCIKNGNNLQPVCRAFGEKLKVVRYIVAPVLDEGRIVCVAWVCNKGIEYTGSDLRQLEAFINGAWFILCRHDFVRKLQAAKEQAEAATRSMSEFLTNVNHELRTPLTSILGYAETLVQLKPDEEDIRNRCIDVIRLKAGQMHKLVLDLLALSRVEGSLPLHFEEILLEELIWDCTEGMYAHMAVKKLGISVEVPQDLMVSADRHMLAQVLRNLLENAVNHASEGSDLEIAAQRASGEVIVSVRNRGPAIDSADLDKLFERFYRGRKTAGQAVGTGVGLSICKHVIGRHGGRIWVENMPDGVRVSFSLPL